MSFGFAFVLAEAAPAVVAPDDFFFLGELPFDVEVRFSPDLVVVDLPFSVAFLQNSAFTSEKLSNFRNKSWTNVSRTWCT